MAPVTEDFNMVLELDQTPTAELIVKSYKRLARKLHPDKNSKHDATEAFQLLGRAYETLKDESKRRAYDLIYPSIIQSRPSQSAQTAHPHSASSSQSEALSDGAQIASILKSKQDRRAQWLTKKEALDSLIVELQSNLMQLEHEIQKLDSIIAAEAAEKNSWGRWLRSTIYKTEDPEEEARKDIARQERRIEKDMKERRLAIKKVELDKQKGLLQKAKRQVDVADLVDDGKIRAIQHRTWARETRERQEREKVERERAAKVWKQQQEQREKREQEQAEAQRKKQAEELATAQKRHEEQARQWQNIVDDERYPYTARRSTSKILCAHDGWWPKIQGRTTCPECYASWSYLLECPSCLMKACPKCQARIRPRWRGRAPLKATTASEDCSYDYFD